ncbi:MAG: helix-hairpin-helix domain-containing protein [Raineya sp.]|nr:helix-hairpin-helix domain-containing protein [Raineya sp.]MDW8295928.1 helix-hairpin-helix domain-containing protein [Raineya sp.]
MWGYWQKIIRDFFGFTQKETNGTIILFALLLILLFLPFLQTWFLGKNIQQVSTNTPLDTLIAHLEGLSNETEPVLPEIELSPFDPNKISKEEWLKLGLNEKVAQRIENYRRKGGKFRKKEDLLRVYDFPEDLYQTLEPFIVIEGNVGQKKPKNQNFKKYAQKESKDFEHTFVRKDTTNKPLKDFQQKISKFDLNKADTAQLKKLRGIGEKRAMNIIKYREKLGGFANLEQIHEVWGLDSLAISSLKKYAYISANSWKKIAINTATVEDMKNHPYIGFRLANTIVNYRLQHGKFQNEADFAKIKAIDETTLQKLKPYLLFD